MTYKAYLCKIVEMKTTLEKVNSRLPEAKYQIRDLEDKVTGNTQSDQQKEKELEKSGQFKKLLRQHEV